MKTVLARSPARERLIEQLSRQASARAAGGNADMVLTTGDVSKLFQVSNRTVRLWADMGKLTYRLTLGGHRRFSGSSVWEAFSRFEDPLALAAVAGA